LPILAGVTVSGWFADPGGKVNTFRWWNGEAWTRWLSADPTAPDPGTEPQPTEPEATPADAASGRTDSLDLAALPPPNPADRVVRLPAAVAIVVAVLLLTVIAVGAVVSITADRPLTGPAVDPPPPTQAGALISYDQVTGKVSFEEMQFIAPRRPFFCDQPRVQGGRFTSVFVCNAVVHHNYDKKNSNWTSAVVMGPLGDSLQAGGDLATITSQTFTAIVRQSYGTDAAVRKRKTEQLTDVAPAGRALLLTAEVLVSKPGLRTKYDRVVLAVVRLSSGQHVAWYALRPSDSPKDVVQALQDCANTITAR
jgi:hypothetical protein